MDTYIQFPGRGAAALTQRQTQSTKNESASAANACRPTLTRGALPELKCRFASSMRLSSRRRPASEKRYDASGGLRTGLSASSYSGAKEESGGTGGADMRGRKMDLNALGVFGVGVLRLLEEAFLLSVSGKRGSAGGAGTLGGRV